MTRNHGRNAYLAQHFGIDPGVFDGAGGFVREAGRLGLDSAHVDGVIAAYDRLYDPVSGAARADNPAANQTASQFQPIIDRYAGQIEELMGQFTGLQETYARDMEQQTNLANALRQQVLFGGGPGRQSAGVSRARYTGAGRNRRGLLGGGSSGDGTLGAQLI